MDGEVNKLTQQIKNDALAAFIEKAGNAFVELETAVGQLPVATVAQWNALLKSIPEIVHSL